MPPPIQAFGLVALALSSLASAQQRSPRPPNFAELRKNLPDLPWVVATALADLDSDGDLDALIATRPPTWLQPDLVLFENDGHAFFRRAANVVAVGKDPNLPWPQGPTYAYYPSVTDLAIADADGDGDQDCLITLLYSGELLLLGNPGALPADGVLYAFETELQLQEYEYLFGVVPADVDADGDVDAVLQVSRFGRASIQLARGLAGGGFAPAPEPILTDAYVGDVADVDGDGNVDVVVAPTSGPTRLLLGAGTGAFSSGPEFPNSMGLVVTGDIDGDLDVDLVFSGFSPHAVLNQGGGHFLEAFDRIPNAQVTALDLIDVDRDHDLDLALGSSVLLNDGAGFFASSGVPYPADPAIESLSQEPGDLDEDGDVDFLLGGKNQILLGDGAGTFLDATPGLRTEARPHEFADLDADGDVDTLVAERDASSLLRWTPLLNDGRGALERSPDTLPATTTRAITFGDLDGDGSQDGFVPVANVLLRNDGHGRFAVAPQGCTPVMEPYILDGALGDLDGDGDLDVFHGQGVPDGLPRYDGLGTYYPKYAALWRNDGSGCFADDSAQLAAISDLGYAVALGDLDLDGDEDAVSSQGTLFLNDGNGVFAEAGAKLAPSTFGYVRDIELGDLDGDGALDICFGSAQAWNDGRGGFPVLTPLEYYAHHVALGDLNHDGRLDVLIGVLKTSYLRGPVISYVEAEVNQGTRTFALAPFPYTDRREFGLDDLDGDGDLDSFDGRRTFFDLELSLAYRSAPRIGHPVVLELHGRPRAPFLLLASRGLRPALPTPFGPWHLDPTRIVLRRLGTLDASGAAEVRFDVPRLPALIGTTLYWQAFAGPRPRLTGFEQTSLTGF